MKRLPRHSNPTKAARQTQNASLEDYDPFGGGGGSGGISVNGVTPSMTSTASPAVMQVLPYSKDIDCLGF